MKAFLLLLTKLLELFTTSLANKKQSEFKQKVDDAEQDPIDAFKHSFGANAERMPDDFIKEVSMRSDKASDKSKSRNPK
ncbi:hypothetical protein J7384_17880 [Endozoicomonas sp. G2_1]|uniref:hypothetical protein n=1 Tax=Endozoicomonas sp. G2_1 TaxID=2821091 RepID=UPI001AD973CE|nr:hypothetical protein [Endozoicomonas sp. G2_1]MBO9492236.1 hypothetical protein [Endozoicomonas sp. G2_1]